MNDLILYDADTGLPTSNVYKYLSGEGDQAVYLSKDGEEITRGELQGLLRSSSLVIQEVGSAWGVSLQDVFRQIPLRGIVENWPHGLPGMMAWWNRIVQKPEKDPGTHLIAGVYLPTVLLGQILEVVKPHYKSYMEARREEIGLEKAVESIWPEALPIDFQADMTTASGQMRIAITRYLAERYPGEDTRIGSDFYYTNDAAMKFMDLITLLAEGESVDDLISDPDISPFWNAIKSMVTFREVEPVEGVPTPEEAKQTVILNNIQNLIQDYQALYGDEGKQKMLDYLTKYSTEFEWARMPDRLVIENVSAKWPSLFEPEEVQRFEAYVREREKEDLEVLQAAEARMSVQEQARLKSERITNTMNTIWRVFQDRYGPAGRILAQLAVDEAKTYGSTLENVGDVLTPEAALSRYVPADVRGIYSLLGKEPTDYLNLLQHPGVNLQNAPTTYRHHVLGEIHKAIQGGQLAPELVATLKDEANKVIATAPPITQGGVTYPREFYLTEEAAQGQYREYLTGALPQAYRGAAWEYFPQVIKNFPEYQRQGAGALFGKHLESLGPTFFSRLTPKQERVSGPKAARLPGATRMPMQ